MTQKTAIECWRRLLATLGLGLSLSMSCSVVAAGEPVSLRHTRTVLAIQQAEPAVVNIEGNKPATTGGASRADAPQVNGMGAGVIIDSRGYILTNQHVVQDVARIEVTLNDGTQYIGRLIARDNETDLALVKIESPRALPVIRFGTSSDLMRGEPVIAIGNPFGYHNTVTEGIISALHRDIPVNGVQYPDLIQTDAGINPGNSGGPLLNAEGNMIGINAAVRVGAQGIGFAIPVDLAAEVAAEMIAQHRRSAFESPLSVRTEFNGGKPQLRVVSGRQGDLEQGDVITAVDNHRIANRLDYELALIGYSGGSQIPIDVERAGRKLSTKLALAARSGATRAQLASSTSLQDQVYRLFGIRLEPADSKAVHQIDPSYKSGLRVTSVRANSPADQAQIKTGDILVGLLEWQTPDWDDLAWIMKSPELKASRTPKFHIMRNRDVFWGTMEVDPRGLQ